MTPPAPDERRRLCRRRGLLTAGFALFLLLALLWLSHDPRGQPEYTWLGGGLLLVTALALYRLGYRSAAWEYPEMPVSAALTPAAADEPLGERLWPGPEELSEAEDDGSVQVLRGPDEGGPPHLMAMRTRSGWQLLEKAAEPDGLEAEVEPEPGLDPLDGFAAYRELALQLLAADLELPADDDDEPSLLQVVHAAEPLPSGLAAELAPELRRFFEEFEQVSYGSDVIGRQFIKVHQVYPRRIAISSEMAYGEVYTVRPHEEGITVMSDDLAPTDVPDHPHIWQLICDWHGTEDADRG